MIQNTQRRLVILFQTNLKASEVFAVAKCDVCNKMFNNKLFYETHLNTKKHKDNISGIQPATSHDAKPKTLQHIHPFKCELCNTKFNGLIPYNMHMKSKKHTAAVQAAKSSSSSFSEQQPEKKIKTEHETGVSQIEDEYISLQNTDQRPSSSSSSSSDTPSGLEPSVLISPQTHANASSSSMPWIDLNTDLDVDLADFQIPPQQHNTIPSDPNELIIEL